jgi:hypothetical protein
MFVTSTMRDLLPMLWAGYGGHWLDCVGLGAGFYDYQICQVLGHWAAEKHGQETANKAGGT